MSGTAALSAAKNRRSGNEVKFNGQSKSLPPPQDTRQRQQPTSQNNRQQQSPAQPAQFQKPPHPMEILKSHELRLREIEGNKTESNVVDKNVPLASSNEYSLLKSDHASLKSDHASLKSDHASLKNIVSALDKKNATNLEQTLTVLKKRFEEQNTLIITLCKQLTEVSNKVDEQSALIEALRVGRTCSECMQGECMQGECMQGESIPGESIPGECIRDNLQSIDGDEGERDSVPTIITNDGLEQNIILEIMPLR
jgi:hypothetical protein